MNKRWTDHEILDAMHQSSNGVEASKIGEKYGVTKSAIIGLVNRCRKDSFKHFPSYDGDGTMPERWWEQREART